MLLCGVADVKYKNANKKNLLERRERVPASEITLVPSKTERNE